MGKKCWNCSPCRVVFRFIISMFALHTNQELHFPLEGKATHWFLSKFRKSGACVELTEKVWR